MAQKHGLLNCTLSVNVMGLRQVHPCTDALQCFSAGVVNLSEALRSLSVHPTSLPNCSTSRYCAQSGNCATAFYGSCQPNPRRWARTTSRIASAMVHYAGHPICYAENPPPSCDTWREHPHEEKGSRKLYAFGFMLNTITILPDMTRHFQNISDFFANSYHLCT